MTRCASLILTRKYRTINPAIAIANTVQNITGLTGIVNQLKKFRLPDEVSVREEIIVAAICGIWLIIPAKITIEIPLPIPCSVINSPSHISNTEPAVMAVTDTIHSMAVGSPKVVVPPWRTVWRKINIKAIDWTTASGTVITRVHCWILRRPDSPSLWSSSSFGMALVNSWIIILAVMNGLSPTSTKEKLDKAPPESRFKIPPKSLWPSTEEIALRSWVGSANGTGICASNRYTTIIPVTISNRFCISLFFNERKIILQSIYS